MNQQEKYIEAIETELANEKLRRINNENQSMQSSAFENRNKDNNIIQYQLDLKEELERMEHLLSGHIIKRDAKGNEYWAEPDDDRLKILSSYGVKQIMNIISTYISRNTLLSHYDEDKINWKMKDFGTEIADLLFCRYEHFFHYPSPEDLFDKYKSIAIKNKIVVDENELYNKCIQWSRDELASKFRHYPILVLSIVDSVHSTFLRALNGEERRSLRKQYQIHESLTANQNYNTPNKFSPMKPSTWTK